jgi:hypothetical protein
MKKRKEPKVKTKPKLQISFMGYFDYEKTLENIKNSPFVSWSLPDEHGSKGDIITTTVEFGFRDFFDYRIQISRKGGINIFIPEPFISKEKFAEFIHLLTQIIAWKDNKKEKCRIVRGNVRYNLFGAEYEDFIEISKSIFLGLRKKVK